MSIELKCVRFENSDICRWDCATFHYDYAFMQLSLNHPETFPQWNWTTFLEMKTPIHIIVFFLRFYCAFVLTINYKCYNYAKSKHIWSHNDKRCLVHELSKFSVKLILRLSFKCSWDEDGKCRRLQIYRVSRCLSNIWEWSNRRKWTHLLVIWR